MAEKQKPEPDDQQKAPDQQAGDGAQAGGEAFEIAGIKLPTEGLDVLKAGSGKFARIEKDTQSPSDKPAEDQAAPKGGEPDPTDAQDRQPEELPAAKAAQETPAETDAQEGPTAEPAALDSSAEPQTEESSAQGNATTDNSDGSSEDESPNERSEEDGGESSKSDIEKEIEAQMMAEFAEADAKREAEEANKPVETKPEPQDAAQPAAEAVAAPAGALPAPQGYYLQPAGNSTQTSIVRMLLLFNVVLAGCLMLAVFWVRPWETRVAVGYQQAPAAFPPAPQQPMSPAAGREPSPPITPTEVEKDLQDSQDSNQGDWALALSWPETEKAFFAHRYDLAKKGYEALLRQSDTQVANERVSDVLRLRIAQCLMGQGQTEESRKMLIHTLESSSPIIRAVSHYQLAAADLLGGQHLRARMRAYRAIAAMAVLGKPMAMETDCDFLIAKALSLDVFTYEDEDDPVAWRQRWASDPFASLSESELRQLLDRGVGLLERNVLGPEIRPIASPSGGQGYSARCTRSTLEEFLTNLSAKTGMDVKWQSVMPEARGRAISVNYRQVSGQRLTEVVCGMVGLMARFTGKEILVYDPQSYTALSEQRDLVSSEATSAWRRLFLRAPGDRRLSEGHFALAVLQEYDGNDLSAMREYQLIAQEFARQQVAAAALMRSAKIRIRLRDYGQARLDLLDPLNRFPNYPHIAQVYLYLGKATMKAGLLTDAIGVYRKLYYMNHTASSRREACLGAARCFWQIGDAEQTATWATRYVGLVDPPDDSLAEACMLLGRSEAARANYSESVAAYYHALAAGPLPARKADALLELAGVHTKSGRFVEAVASLDRLGSMKLSPAQTCQYALMSAEVYRATTLADKAVAVLRRYLRVTSDPQMSAKLILALADSYVDQDKLEMAEQVLANALPEMTAGQDWYETACRLAEICLELNKTDQAETLAKELRNPACSPEIRARAAEVLGSVYIIKQQYDLAALAFSGLDIYRQAGAPQTNDNQTLPIGGQAR